MLESLPMEDVKRYVREDIDLAELVHKKLSEFDPVKRFLVTAYVRVKRKEILKLLSEDVILSELEQRRPDIAEELKREPGLLWLRRNLAKIRKLVSNL